MSKTVYSSADRVESNMLCFAVCSQLMKSSIAVGCNISCKLNNFSYKNIVFQDLPYYRCLIQSCMWTLESLNSKQTHFVIPCIVDPMTNESKECSMIGRSQQIGPEMCWKGGFTELFDNRQASNIIGR